MAQSMKDEGYEQPSLQTDTEPLPKLKEGELLYLSAAIEVWMGIAPWCIEDERRSGTLSFWAYFGKRKGGDNAEGTEGTKGEETESV